MYLSASVKTVSYPILSQPEHRYRIQRVPKICHISVYPLSVDWRTRLGRVCYVARR